MKDKKIIIVGIVIAAVIAAVIIICGISVRRNQNKKNNYETASSASSSVDEKVKNESIIASSVIASSDYAEEISSASSSDYFKNEEPAEGTENQKNDSSAASETDNHFEADEVASDSQSTEYYEIPKGHGDGANLNFEKYGRDGERYTQGDIQMDETIELPNIDDVASYIPGQIPVVNHWLTLFAKRKNLTVTKAEVVGYVFDQLDGTKLQIYFQYDDPDKTLATLLYQSGTTTKGAYFDVLPCQWTIQEINNRVYEGEEIQ